MPEALTIAAVFTIAVAIYAGVRMQIRQPALNQPHEERARMQQQVKWLEERLAAARRENWGSEMMASIAAERDATVEQLAKSDA